VRILAAKIISIVRQRLRFQKETHYIDIDVFLISLV
jgi:hypothetical protein